MWGQLLFYHSKRGCRNPLHGKNVISFLNDLVLPSALPDDSVGYADVGGFVVSDYTVNRLRYNRVGHGEVPAAGIVHVGFRTDNVVRRYPSAGPCQIIHELGGVWMAGFDVIHH
jgi:hypothetical protein